VAFFEFNKEKYSYEIGKGDIRIGINYSTLNKMKQYE